MRFRRRAIGLDGEQLRKLSRHVCHRFLGGAKPDGEAADFPQSFEGHVVHLGHEPFMREKCRKFFVCYALCRLAPLFAGRLRPLRRAFTCALPALKTAPSAYSSHSP